VPWQAASANGATDFRQRQTLNPCNRFDRLQNGLEPGLMHFVTTWRDDSSYDLFCAHDCLLVSRQPKRSHVVRASSRASRK
jgi:hypothetical protein